MTTINVNNPPYYTINTSNFTGAAPTIANTQFSTTTANNWAYINSTDMPTLSVKGNASFEGDVEIKGRDIVQMLEAIEKRLAILVPDPEKLEHFEALRRAYEHYKTLEAMCQLPEKKDER